MTQTVELRARSACLQMTRNLAGALSNLISRRESLLVAGEAWTKVIFKGPFQPKTF